MLTECEQERHQRVPLLATFSLWDSVDRPLVVFPQVLRRRPVEHGHEGNAVCLSETSQNGLSRNVKNPCNTWATPCSRRQSILVVRWLAPWSQPSASDDVSSHYPSDTSICFGQTCEPTRTNHVNNSLRDLCLCGNTQHNSKLLPRRPQIATESVSVQLERPCWNMMKKVLEELNHEAPAVWSASTRSFLGTTTDDLWCWQAKLVETRTFIRSLAIQSTQILSQLVVKKVLLTSGQTLQKCDGRKHKQQQNKKTTFWVSTGLHVGPSPADGESGSVHAVVVGPPRAHQHQRTHVWNMGRIEPEACAALQQRECGGVQGSWKKSEGCVCSEIQWPPKFWSERS